MGNMGFAPMDVIPKPFMEKINNGADNSCYRSQV